jgi:hypothetical protein
MDAKQLVLVLIILVVAAGGICFVFHIDVIGMVQNALSGAVAWFTNLTAELKLAFAGLLGSFGGFIGWIKTKLNFNGFKKTTAATTKKVESKMGELEQISAQKDVVIQNVTARAETAETKVQTLESEYTNYKTVLDGKEDEIKRLQAQIEGQQKLFDGTTKEKLTSMSAEVAKEVKKVG